MTEKRFSCETKTQGCVSIDLMKDNGQIIEKFEAINLLNEQHETITDLEEKEIELGRNYLIKLEFEQKVKDTLQKEIYNINETIFNMHNDSLNC